MAATTESLYGPYRWGRYDLLVMPPSFPFGGVENPQLNGIHGLLQGDVDRDGRIDLIANSAQPMDTPFPESILWLSVPTQPRSGAPWKANPFADKDAPGLTHYMGFGDVNGDGRPDIATGAKGSPSPVGNYFAWWEAPANPAQPWNANPAK